MKGMPSRVVSSLSLPAVSRIRPSLSTTQGPAMMNSGWSAPTVKLISFTSGALGYWHLLLPVRARRLHEAREQRMAVARRRRERGVELARDEERMRRQLDHLDQAVAREAGKAQPRVHHLLQVAVVELVAVAVALLDHVRAVDLVRARAVRQPHFLRAEPHRAAHFGLFGALFGRALLVLPLGDQRDHGMRRRPVELGGVRAVQARDVTRVLDDRELHAEADAQVRDAAFARVLDRLDLALDAALAEAAGHQDRVDAVQQPRAVLLDVGRLDELDLDAR